MCIKHHQYYVCNCQNPECPARYVMCCPYGPHPSVLASELGHILPQCKSTDTPCDPITSLSRCHMEPCRRSCKVELHRKNVGLCADCQDTCAKRQTGISTVAHADRHKALRSSEEDQRAKQEEEWKRAVDSDGED